MALIFLLALTKIYPCRKIKKICHLSVACVFIERAQTETNVVCLIKASLSTKTLKINKIVLLITL